MKKIRFVMVLTGVLLAGLVSAQPFIKGTNVVSATVGFGSAIGSFTYGSQTPGISLQYERGIWDIGGPGVISLGGYAGIKSFKYSGSSSGYTYSQKWNYKVIGVRSAYHYNGLDQEKLDVYGGIMASFNILSYKYEDNYGGAGSSGSFGSSAGFTAFVGGRYFFTPNLAGVAELGYGVSYLSVGLALKF